MPQQRSKRHEVEMTVIMEVYAKDRNRAAELALIFANAHLLDVINLKTSEFNETKEKTNVTTA